MKSQRNLLIPAFAFLFACAATSTLRAQSRHETELAAAWEDYSNNRFDEALAHCDIILREFRFKAEREQEKVAGRPVPSGFVDDEQKKAIQANGVINDVATTHFLRGKILGSRPDKADDAKAAFAEAEKLPSARCWDPVGKFFWSPSKAARWAVKYPHQPDLRPNAYYTMDAWEALDAKNYDGAINVCKECVSDFMARAVELENDLRVKGTPLPVGMVDEAMKKIVHSYGVLNDTATCQFVMGKAAEAKGDFATSRKAYTDATSLSNGRCWDPKGGFFWSPAEGAGDALRLLPGSRVRR